MTETATDLAKVNLDTRYTAESGTIFLTGMQAMLRLLVEQARADRRQGLNTAGFLSGYPGSPLGGVDSEYIRNAKQFEAESIRHQLGLNEELAATAVYGTQLLHQVPGAKYDGVFGMWFGKAPGVDRAADAFRHANYHGVGRNGGVLVVAGDDPHARSTILPADSNVILSSFYMPVLYPGTVQEVIDFGLHGYALSRASGLWVALKLISDVADGFGTANIDPGRVVPSIPEATLDGTPLQLDLKPNQAGAPMIEREREIYYGRLNVARAYARVNGLNRIVAPVPGARRGIVGVGKGYHDLREALHMLGLNDRALEEAGIRLLKVGMPFPFDEVVAREFADGLDEILVVEDKRPFVETLLKEALYGQPAAPRISGKSDVQGQILLPASGELSVDLIRAAVSRWLGRVDVVSQPGGAQILPLSEARTPYFCSGCPHNRSLRVPEGAVVGAGIGCHIMTLWMGPVMGDVVGFTQMGGEGAQWVGLSGFTDTGHFFQNLGDGTYAHSGSLAIRNAVAAGKNITYKLLYNSAVAMTGGQSVFAGQPVRSIIDQLTAEGVKRIIVTADEPERYRGQQLGPIATVRHRDDLLEAEKELAATTGVTVLIHDQQCAAEKRRLRKRGKLESKTRRVMINERVCEGCGDCGVKSNCLSVEPVSTEFGRKTRINQTSCNQDYSCLLGDCPSFMTIEGAAPKRSHGPVAMPDVRLPDPLFAVPEEDFAIVMAGIGGTGVVTVNQILGMAAALAGRAVRGMDQTGSSQKAGPVVSHLRVLAQDRSGASRIPAGGADLFLAFDLLSAADRSNIVIASPQRTVLVGNGDAVPTGGMVSDVNRVAPPSHLLRGRLAAVTRPNPVLLDALALSRRLFGNEVSANLLLVGAAYQAGALPLPLNAIEAAIRMNGVSVDANLNAFRWGRIAVAEPGVIETLLAPPAPIAPEKAALDPDLEALLAGLDLEPALADRIRLRVVELIAFQDAALARHYLQRLGAVREGERRRVSGDSRLTAAVALNLYKLLAYKDEYEVARLMVSHYDAARAAGEIGDSQKVKWLLHPTFLRSLGVRKKVHLGGWFVPVARVLARMKWIRGSAFDLFGATRVRRTERQLIGDYEALIDEILAWTATDDFELLVKLAELPDMVRGYEDVKLRNIERFHAQRASLVEKMDISKQKPEAGNAQAVA